MQQEIQTKLKRWPTPQDYNEAVQNIHVNLNDSELRTGEIELDALGLPRPMTGAFASVYKVKCANRDWAVRCFLRDVPDVQMRYEKISEFIMNDSLACTVGFDFEATGISVGSNWYPILKMEWVDGETLDNYLHSNDGRVPAGFANTFKEMIAGLQSAGIAHGDLQHGNIIIRDDQFFLIDYDGMYVPALAGHTSNELGHRNYQHPMRSREHFGPFLDNFSAWVIYCSLLCLEKDPNLWDELAGGADCLLLRREDFQYPTSSYAFATLENHPDEEIVGLSHFVRYLLTLPPDKIPFLNDQPVVPCDLPPITPCTRRHLPYRHKQPELDRQPTSFYPDRPSQTFKLSRARAPRLVIPKPNVTLLNNAITRDQINLIAFGNVIAQPFTAMPDTHSIQYTFRGQLITKTFSRQKFERLQGLDRITIFYDQFDHIILETSRFDTGRHIELSRPISPLFLLPYRNASYQRPRLLLALYAFFMLIAVASIATSRAFNLEAVAFFAIFFAVVGETWCYLTRIGAPESATYRSLVESGLPAIEGTILSFDPAANIVSYVWTDQSGTEHTSEMHSIQFRWPEPGTKVTVLYNPNTYESVAYEYCTWGITL